MIILIWLSLSLIEAHNILFLSPITSQSHTNFFKPVVKELVDRGHSVTYWNGLKPSGSESSRLRLLYSPQVGQINSDHQVRFSDRSSQFQLFFGLVSRMETYCKIIHQDPVFQQLIHSKDRYDLIVLEGSLNECVLPLVEILDTPFIYMIGMSPFPWLLESVASPLAMDHLPLPGFSFTDQMNLWQRTLNTLCGLMGLYFRYNILMPVVDRVAGQLLGNNLTAVKDIESRYVNLLIINTHFSLNYQLPTSGAVIQAGGLHCVPAKPLTPDLESFVDQSGDAGFIIVSFGSILRGLDLPENVRRIFLSTFGRLEQRILWKWENQSLFENDPIPANVKLLSWLPQQDLLGHPKSRLFITQGGLMSNQEAVYHSVPLIVLPVFADQPINAQKAHDDGYAIRLDWDDLTEDILYEAIQQILHNPKYTERMDQISSLMRDEMDRPLDRAVYWIEYVIRHRGSHHLRPASRRLSLIQRGLVDVMLVLFLFSTLAIYIGCRLLRWMISLTTKTTVTDVKIILKKKE